MRLAQAVAIDHWSSFRTPCIAEHAVAVRDIEQLLDALTACEARGLPTTLLGGGTNVVLRDHVPGCVIRVEIRGLTREDEQDQTVVSAGAGEVWHELVRFCIGQGLAGIENLALIPGCVGAAPIQNIGAYGMELSERLRDVTVVDRTSGAIRVMEAGECELAYRDSAFKGRLRDRYVIVSLRLALTRHFRPVLDYPDVARELAAMGVRANAATVAEAVIRVRRRKLPDYRQIGNAGSFFKNPIVTSETLSQLERRLAPLPSRRSDESGTRFRIPAARLIEACGYKGLRRGPVGVWQRQPLVLVNHGGARGADLLALAAEIHEKVAERFGVELELEPSVLGCDRSPGRVLG